MKAVYSIAFRCTCSTWAIAPSLPSPIPRAMLIAANDRDHLKW